MASLARTTLLRQTVCFAIPASRSLRVASAPTGPLPLCLLGQRRLLQPNSSVLSKPSIFQLAAFHASSRRSIIPPGPQVLDGTVNDPAPVPPASPAHGHYHWTIERVLAAGLVPLTMAPFAAGSLNPTLDAILCSTLLVHCHMGLQAIIIDYIPQKRFPMWRKLFMYGLNAATILVGIGMYEFETTDVGLVEAIKRIWKA